MKRDELKEKHLRLGDVIEWIYGSFNACIPIYISPSPRNLNLPEWAIIRFPLPYKTREAFFPGNVDEKLRSCYIHLFTVLENESLFNRLRWYFRSVRAWVSGHTLSPYFAHPRRSILDVGYLVIEHIGEGKMLSRSWKEHRGDPDRRANLFRDLSWIILSTINDQGIPSLTNRPLARQLRGGPFVLTLTDFHQSNIFVDDDWHITRLIDLEWACVRPIEMLSPPTWLSSAGVGKSALGIDELIGEELDSYASAHEEFMKMFEAEESALRYFWYARALDCLTGLYFLFMFYFGRVVAPY
ncbi:hypothetical protein B0T26DRAFT_737508 [Lasiosphaeria miniovina]|uniref:Aminoglycoside phosphotransferase domain-containing protein n=1 Tax=Lasiosphaeria miniovina TaxID=1954250 RepID=A0AA40ECK8_9PEZI|nr:uncharacterized protein B0T26DRAFT_737508 [Lasiosphaeria miniovina]KAK0735050.1 hypothetical protein B0T26DRAFT_737508 [Lasiosphaeria miniovina]